jgi:hypothetical protein
MIGIVFVDSFPSMRNSSLEMMFLSSSSRAIYQCVETQLKKRYIAIDYEYSRIISPPYL